MQAISDAIDILVLDQARGRVEVSLADDEYEQVHHSDNPIPEELDWQVQASSCRNGVQAGTAAVEPNLGLPVSSTFFDLNVILMPLWILTDFSCTNGLLTRAMGASSCGSGAGRVLSLGRASAQRSAQALRSTNRGKTTRQFTFTKSSKIKIASEAAPRPENGASKPVLEIAIINVISYVSLISYIFKGKPML